VTITSISDLITNINREKRDVQRRHKDARDRAHDIIKQAQAEGRANLTDDESNRFDALLKQSRDAADQLDQIDDRLEECRTVALESAENEAAARDTKPSGARKPSYDRVAHVGSEERVYRRDDQRTGRPSFLRDLALGQVFQDPAANDRLSRHARETEVDGLAGPQARAIGTGAVSGLVPPQYVIQQFAELARVGRPLANAVASLPLPPDGMSVNISTITTGTSTASQASEMWPYPRPTSTTPF
jgi:hypothetical protein